MNLISEGAGNDFGKKFLTVFPVSELEYRSFFPKTIVGFDSGFKMDDIFIITLGPRMTYENPLSLG